MGFIQALMKLLNIYKCSAANFDSFNWRASLVCCKTDKPGFQNVCLTEIESKYYHETHTLFNFDDNFMSFCLKNEGTRRQIAFFYMNFNFNNRWVWFNQENNIGSNILYIHEYFNENLYTIYQFTDRYWKFLLVVRRS